MSEQPISSKTISTSKDEQPQKSDQVQDQSLFVLASIAVFLISTVVFLVFTGLPQIKFIADLLGIIAVFTGVISVLIVLLAMLVKLKVDSLLKLLCRAYTGRPVRSLISMMLMVTLAWCGVIASQFLMFEYRVQVPPVRIAELEWDGERSPWVIRTSEYKVSEMLADVVEDQQEGRLARAQTAIQTLSELHRADTTFARLLAEIAYKRGDYESALKAIERVVALSQEDLSEAVAQELEILRILCMIEAGAAPDVRASLRDAHALLEEAEDQRGVQDRFTSMCALVYLRARMDTQAYNIEVDPPASQVLTIFTASEAVAIADYLSKDHDDPVPHAAIGYAYAIAARLSQREGDPDGAYLQIGKSIACFKKAGMTNTDVDIQDAYRIKASVVVDKMNRTAIRFKTGEIDEGTKDNQLKELRDLMNACVSEFDESMAATSRPETPRDLRRRFDVASSRLVATIGMDDSEISLEQAAAFRQMKDAAERASNKLGARHDVTATLWRLYYRYRAVLDPSSFKDGYGIEGLRGYVFELLTVEAESDLANTMEVLGTLVTSLRLSDQQEEAALVEQIRESVRLWLDYVQQKKPVSDQP